MDRKDQEHCRLLDLEVYEGMGFVGLACGGIAYFRPRTSGT